MIATIEDIEATVFSHYVLVGSVQERLRTTFILFEPNDLLKCKNGFVILRTSSRFSYCDSIFLIYPENVGSLL